MSETPDSEARDLINTIDFGLEVQAFLNSKIGKHLIDRAEGEVEEAVEKLKVIDPKESDKIQSLQNQIFRAESIQYWLAEVIQAGVQAEVEFQDRGAGGG